MLSIWTSHKLSLGKMLNSLPNKKYHTSPYLRRLQRTTVVNTKVHNLAPLQEHVRKVVGGFGKKNCVCTDVRNMCH